MSPVPSPCYDGSDTYDEIPTLDFADPLMRALFSEEVGVQHNPSFSSVFVILIYFARSTGAWASPISMGTVI